MRALVVQDIEKSYGNRLILRGCSLVVEDQERVGIVGVNGAGKSTLLKIISGLEEADSGDIYKPVTVAILHQHPQLKGRTVGEAVREASKWHQELLDAYQHAIDHELWEDMNRLQDRLDQVGWDITHNVDAMLQRLQAPSADRSLHNLSGGEIRRVAMAKVLLSNADLLILDEPTNHLDTETIEWLESFLVGYRGAVLLVTHDRYMLETVASRIVEVEDGLCVSYEGSYGDYLVASAERQMQLRKAEERRLKLIATEAQWAARSPAARSTKQKARLQRLDDLQSQRDLPQERELSWNFVTEDRFGATLLEVENLALRFGDRELFSNVNFTISPKQRLGIVGANGTGKSSLLKIISGVLQPNAGQLKKQSRLQIGLLDQHRTGLNPEDTVFEAAGASDFVEVNGRNIHVVGFLAKFLFPREMLDQKVALLSGGERARLLMAKLMLQGANLLLLDEPTNDLDLLTLRALEEALLEFGGAVLLVTHDRAFLDRVCTGVLAFQNQKLLPYADRQQVMLAEKQYQAELAAQEALQKQAKKDANTTEMRQNESVKNSKTKLSYKERKELDALPDQIENLEQRVAQIHEILSDPNTYSDSNIDVSALNQELAQSEDRILELMERWETLSELDS